ncbi:MAG TPA: cation:proton antiporter, partial [Arenimonas sp.]|nr:cation:proton antiporter [Arenimonas sp.]
PGILNLLQMQINGEGMRLLAEIALAIVLFTDAAKANLTVLKTYNWIPLRLLLIGLPLCLLAGWLFGLWLFPNMHWLEVAILATILAPTDAALGKAVVSNPDVPAPVRESLNVESGLNDGICVPVLLFLLALIAPEEMHRGTLSTAVWLFIEEIGIGVLVGFVLAYTTAGMLRITIAKRWSMPVWRQLMLPGLAVLCFAMAQWLGGSGFIAAFVGGLFIGHLLPTEKEHALEANEEFGELLSVIVWLVFGSMVIVNAWPYFNWQVWVYAFASLTFLRMFPVWLSLMNTPVAYEQRLFIGWFGPRGLASIVFLLIVMPYNLNAGQQITATVIATILLSVILHGLSANPWVARFKRAS